MSKTRNELAQGLINLSNRWAYRPPAPGSNITNADRALMREAAGALRIAGCSCKMRTQATGPEKCKWCDEKRYEPDAYEDHVNEAEKDTTPADDNARRRLDSVVMTLEDNYSWNHAHKQDKLDALREVVLHILGK